MKKLIFSSLVFSSVLLSCGYFNKQQKDCEIKVAEYADSNEYALLKMSIDLPEGEEKISKLIRDALNNVIKKQLINVTKENNDSIITTFNGQTNDENGLLKFYGQQVFKNLAKNAKAENKRRLDYIESDKTISQETKKTMKEAIMQWTYDMSIKKIEETDNYVVYLSQDYKYLGGAHGSVVGSGPMTFNLKTGKQVTDFIRTKELVHIQPLIKEGLKNFYSTDGKKMTDAELKSHLLIDVDTIPLPVYYTYPSSEGIVFTYQQYEIAPYSDGMPTFTVAYDKIKPYLTQEAKELLEIK